SEGFKLGHAPCSRAARAAATALSTSALSASATAAIVRPVAGLITAIVFPDCDATHSPPINNRGGRPRKAAATADGDGCAAMTALMESPESWCSSNMAGSEEHTSEL